MDTTLVTEERFARRFGPKFTLALNKRVLRTITVKKNYLFAQVRGSISEGPCRKSSLFWEEQLAQGKILIQVLAKDIILSNLLTSYHKAIYHQIRSKSFISQTHGYTDK